MSLIFDKGSKGRVGMRLPKNDVNHANDLPANLLKKKTPALPEVSELEAIRHYVNLSRKNMGIETTFYPLGSCTMKYNPRFHEAAAALPGFAGLHPLISQIQGGEDYSQGALAVLYGLQEILKDVLGFEEFCLQPLAGAHGEMTGIMLIAAYHKARNDEKRNVILIPDAAHGTNPATAALAGFETRTVASDELGNVNMQSLEEALGPDIAGLMITMPNTIGLFDPNIRKINEMVHEAGGLIYGDGANLNAVIGRIKPGNLGFDVMHVNLHKTCTTPHGGGGPGAGPIGVSNRLKPYLPVPLIQKNNEGKYSLDFSLEGTIGRVASYYGNFGVLLRAYAYLLTVGKEGLIRISENAVINANYIRVKLKDYYDQAFDRVCLHECVFKATRQAKKGVHALDISKALLDKGFHPPTMYFPLVVPEALMIEPTETESKQTLDLFIQAMIEIAESAETDPEDFHHAPKTTPVGRLDETLAARKPDLAYLEIEESEHE